MAIRSRDVISDVTIQLSIDDFLSLEMKPVYRLVFEILCIKVMKSERHH